MGGDEPRPYNEVNLKAPTGKTVGGEFALSVAAAVVVASASAAIVIAAAAATAAVEAAEQKYDYYENDDPFAVIAAKHLV